MEPAQPAAVLLNVYDINPYKILYEQNLGKEAFLNSSNALNLFEQQRTEGIKAGFQHGVKYANKELVPPAFEFGRQVGGFDALYDTLGYKISMDRNKIPDAWSSNADLMNLPTDEFVVATKDEAAKLMADWTESDGGGKPFLKSGDQATESKIKKSLETGKKLEFMAPTGGYIKAPALSSYTTKKISKIISKKMHDYEKIAGNVEPKISGLLARAEVQKQFKNSPLRNYIDMYSYEPVELGLPNKIDVLNSPNSKRKEILSKSKHAFMPQNLDDIVEEVKQIMPPLTPETGVGAGVKKKLDFGAEIPPLPPSKTPVRKRVKRPSKKSPRKHAGDESLTDEDVRDIARKHFGGDPDE